MVAQVFLVFACVVAALPHTITGEEDCSQSNPCLNQGTCIELEGNATCVCREGWTGPLCSTDIDHCTANLCMNGATCTDLPPGSQSGDFICDCTENWGGTLCGVCTIAFCKVCGGSLAACAQCEDGYRLNQTTDSCMEEEPSEDDPFFSLSHTWTLVILSITGALFVAVCLCVCTLSAVNCRIVRRRKGNYSVTTGSSFFLDELPTSSEDNNERTGFKVCGPNDIDSYSHVKPKTINPMSLGLESIPIPNPADISHRLTTSPDAVLVPTFNPSLLVTGSLPPRSPGTRQRSANATTSQSLPPAHQAAIRVSRSMDIFTMEPLAGSTPARPMHKSRSSEMLLGFRGSTSVLDTGMSTPGDTPPLPPRTPGYSDDREYLSQPLLLYGVPLIPAESTSVEAMSPPMTTSDYCIPHKLPTAPQGTHGSVDQIAGGQ